MFYNNAMTQTITLKLTSEQETRLYEAFKDTAAKTPPYARWQLRPENCVITCYESGKTVFQGKDAQVYAAAFQSVSGDVLPQAGSDEVGTGDFFGPVCVCASIVTEETVGLLQKLGVRDSKALDDDAIRRIAPELMEALPHSLLVLDNKTYNRVHTGNNMNAIKSKLHNKAYVNLSRKASLPQLIVIDQFTPEASYYRYLIGEPQIVDGIHFETKAENKYPAVGASSIIARYAFLKSMDSLSAYYGMEIVKGAGASADVCAAEFVKKFGKERLGECAKLHFKNTEKLNG